MLSSFFAAPGPEEFCADDEAAEAAPVWPAAAGNPIKPGQPGAASRTTAVRAAAAIQETRRAGPADSATRIDPNRLDHSAAAAPLRASLRMKFSALSRFKPVPKSGNGEPFRARVGAEES